jgi:peptide/nickel transport system substrate-binding protein
VLALGLAACGGSSSSSSGTSSGASPGGGKTITLAMGVPPDSLDPGFGYTTQAADSSWLVYTGLVTYAHENGNAGGNVIAGLATSLPQISADGKTYTFTLRKGLTYSDGKPVKASDFPYTVERTIKIPWGGSGQFLTNQIVGGKDYSKGKAKSISGITADDASGKIVIHLVAPYGAFVNVLGFPALGLVPSGTPMQNMPNSPPPGDGPYMYGKIVPNQSFETNINPKWAAQNIPAIPSGHVNVLTKISSNVNANALSVLQNSADVFDWADTVPGSLLPQINSQASGRFKKQVMNSTYYFFMNTETKPFNNQLAREAVITGIDQNALSRLGSGTLIPGCFFLPPGMVGHPTSPCPYGDPSKGGDLAKAKQLVQQSGTAGTAVTVWGQERTPRRQWVDYYADFLNKIGYKATEKIIAGGTYFATIGNLKLNAQTGFDDWNQDFPNPIDFYLLVQSSAILATNNQNHGQIKDPHIDSESNALGSVPTPRLSTVASKWQALDEYTAKKAYVGVFGYQTFPEFTSTKVNFGSIVWSPVYGYDYSSFQ